MLKEGDSIKNQPNDNMPNSKLKSLYNFSKDKWMLKYGTTRFQPHHTNSVLVETWEEFMVSSGNIIRDSFDKTNLTHLSPTNMITNTQACVASTQTSSKGIIQFAEDTLAPIKLLKTRTNHPIVIIHEKFSIQELSRKIILWAAAYEANCPLSSGYEEGSYDNT